MYSLFLPLDTGCDKLPIRMYPASLVLMTILILCTQLTGEPIVYLTGNPEDKVVSPENGILLAGGGGDVGASMAWLLGKANEGDVVVLRASGGDGYNDYLYSELGVSVNSVRTIVFSNIEDASDQRVIQWIRQAELVFLAGGDQAKYFNYWHGSPVQDALNAHFAAGKPIGGTSAGLAVLGEFAYVALHDKDLTSDIAMSDPDSPLLTLARGFLKVPLLQRILTDSHFSQRNRLGRLMVMLKKVESGDVQGITGLGIDEQTTLCIEADGKSIVRSNGTGTASLVSLEKNLDGDDRITATIIELKDGTVFNITQISDFPGTTRVAYLQNGYLRQFPVSGVNDVPDRGPAGKLIIVGGGLRASNDEVFDEIIHSGDLLSDGKIGIVPVASGKPMKYSEEFRRTLIGRGVQESRIEILPLAVADDSSTEFDESLWKENASDPDLLKTIDECSSIWFIGGDQARIMQVARSPDAGDTPFLKALRRLYWRGGVVGGTSADAAVQSDIMILGGSSPAALRYGSSSGYSGMDQQESGPLLLGNGIGFFPHGIVDQHFDRKARLGRLIVAIMDNTGGYRHGYGIDEDTALVYDAAKDSAIVKGNATVVHVNASEATRSAKGISGVRISVLCSGDTISWPDSSVSVNPLKTRTNGNEYLSIKDPEALGLFSPYGGRLEDALGFLLMDNKLSGMVRSEVRYPDGAGRLLTFSSDEKTLGYWGYLDGTRDSYSVINAVLRIGPLQLPVSE